MSSARRYPHAAILAAAFLAACGSPQSRAEPAVTFVHATDPHLFLERKVDTLTANRLEVDSARRIWQERLDRDAMRALFSTLGAMNPADRPEFVLFTGDWGIDTTTTPIPGQAPPTSTEEHDAPRGGPTSQRDPSVGGVQPRQVAAQLLNDRWMEQADTLAALLNLSPVKQIYWVPGNNDIAGERADLATLAKADEFSALVSQRLRNGVTLQNLTACYAGQPGTCTVDVPDTRYTLVGFPSVSFKNRNVAPGDTATFRQLQEGFLARAAEIVALVAARGRRVLLATHIPEMDDPYERGQQLFAGRPAARTPLGASAWNVSDTAFARWKSLVESPAVAAVLAGHFHDSHREVYYPPYSWAEASALRADPQKLLLAPPLSVKNQDVSPIQARGFALIYLSPDSVKRRLFWLNPRIMAFAPDPQAVAAPVRRPTVPTGIAWLWSLSENPMDLARAAAFAIALLAAFLTAVALWEIPKARPDMLTPTTPPTTAASPPPEQQSSALQGNFARTVLTGLAGMASVALLDSFWAEARFNARTYYIVLFVTFFLTILLAYALLRGVTESLRSRIANPWQPPIWMPPTVGTLGNARTGGSGRRGRASLGEGLQLLGSWILYWLGRFRRWLLSLRGTILIFIDTTLNVLIGRNELKSAVWEQTIVDLQWTLYQTIERIRETVTTAVQDAVENATAHDPAKRPDLDRAFRVSISLLAEDGRSVFYVTAAPGSISTRFPPQSIAWVAIYSGQARWWRKTYGNDWRLFDNTAATLPGVAAGPLRIGDFWQVRHQRDYEAFIVLPVPWRRRGAEERYRKGAIHISFRDEEIFRALWPQLEPEWVPVSGAAATDLPPEEGRDPYARGNRILESEELGADPVLTATLRQAVAVLGAVIQEFNEGIFEVYIKPCQDR